MEVEFTAGAKTPSVAPPNKILNPAPPAVQLLTINIYVCPAVTFIGAVQPFPATSSDTSTAPLPNPVFPELAA